ncbi:MAG TPA: hypothetical protein VII56_09470 [Rhizomicrobium sp.]
MEIKDSPPPCGEVEKSWSDFSGGGPHAPPGTAVIAVARSWIGTPYIHQASVKGAGCDCLGLLRGVWRELNGQEPEEPPPYSPDWAESTVTESLYQALRRHMTQIKRADLAPGDVALFRMTRSGPAKHCGIVASQVLPLTFEGARETIVTLIHARQNRRVAEETLTPFWHSRLAYAFRLT